MAKKGENTRVPFTKEQLAQIEKADALELKRLAEEWGRTYESLRRKRYAMRHSDEDRISKRKYKRKLKHIAKQEGYISWTKAEELEIMTSELTDVELAKKLGRSVPSVWAKRSRLMRKNNANKDKEYE